MGSHRFASRSIEHKTCTSVTMDTMTPRWRPFLFADGNEFQIPQDVKRSINGKFVTFLKPEN